MSDVITYEIRFCRYDFLCDIIHARIFRLSSAELSTLPIGHAPSPDPEYVQYHSELDLHRGVKFSYRLYNTHRMNHNYLTTNNGVILLTEYVNASIPG